MEEISGRHVNEKKGKMEKNKNMKTNYKLSHSLIIIVPKEGEWVAAGRGTEAKRPVQARIFPYMMPSDNARTRNELRAVA